jgi:integrase
MSTENAFPSRQRDAWNRGRLIGQKRPLKPRDVWTIRVRLQMEGRKRDLAMFNLAIDSKLRGCDLVRLRIDDVCAGGRVRDRATVIRKKTGRPVRFEITEQTRSAIGEWLAALHWQGPIFVPEPFPGAAAPLDATVRPYRPPMGGAPVSIVRRTVRTRCAARRWLRFTRRPATRERCSCCSAIRSWRARFAISGSRWKMRSASRSKSS